MKREKKEREKIRKDAPKEEENKRDEKRTFRMTVIWRWKIKKELMKNGEIKVRRRMKKKKKKRRS